MNLRWNTRALLRAALAEESSGGGRRRPRGGDDSGQALVESAIVMPLMVFIILGVVQMTMIQHARIMTEYAAFNAARAGIVWNGDPWVMENAAIISLMPTYGAMVDEMGLADPGRMAAAIAERALLFQVNRRLTGFASILAGPVSGVIRRVFGGDGPQVVEVTVLNPTRRDFTGDAQELDFDDIGTDGRAQALREANRLTIQVRYLYVMRVPFANWVIHHAWMSQRAGIELHGAIWNPQADSPGETGFSAERDVESTYRDIGRGLRGDDRILRDLALAGREGAYILPLYATYTMRMQSNLFLMHF